ncbi:DarP family protein [Desulfogranum japonicum]|uniref:DarP family protein n=1 Tax=Desulfogranum japonicum TaxID=231447 RepID=UPI00041B80A9|nr:DUF615 domain-containing protein [Desulfogranum japonicum]
MQLSRSEQKRRIKQVEKLVQELSTLSPQVIRQLPCDSETQELLSELDALKGGAKKRQLKYVTKLLRDQPLEELYAFISARRGERLRKNKHIHDVEYMRDQLIDECLAKKKYVEEEGGEWSEQWPSEVVEMIAREMPGIEKPSLLRLAYLFAQTRNPRHSREMYRYLLAQKEQEQYR